MAKKKKAQVTEPTREELSEFAFSLLSYSSAFRISI